MATRKAATFDAAAFLAGFSKTEQILATTTTEGKCPGFGIDDKCGEKLGTNRKTGEPYEVCMLHKMVRDVYGCGYCENTDVREQNEAARLIATMMEAGELPGHVLDKFMQKEAGRAMPQGSPDMIFFPPYRRNGKIVRPGNWTHFSCYRKEAEKKERLDAYYTGADRD